MRTLIQYVERLLFPALDHIVHSIPEKSYDRVLVAYVKEVVRIRDAECVTYGPPDVMPSWFRQQHAFSARNLYKFKNCEMILPVGGVMCGGRWLQESFGHYRNVLVGVGQWRKKNLYCWKPSYEVEEPCTYLRITGYYHFLLEVLPSLLLTIERCPGVSLLLYCTSGEAGYSFPKQYLEILRKRGKALRTVKVDCPMVRCRSLALVQQEEKSGFVHPSDVRLLRETFLPPPGERAARGVRLFVSRRRAKRAFDNQADVESFLRAQGFECVELEKLTVDDQIMLFNRAEVVVGSHGAGLANLVWCGRCRLLVELFSPRFLNDCYYRLACTLKIDYRFMVADEAGVWGKIDLSKLAVACVGA